jgi:probable HAF family extracellular repeat protein
VIIALSSRISEVFSVKTIGFLLMLAVFAAASPIYTVAGLGGLPGGTSTGYAINSSGTVAGWAENASGNQQAFVSTPNGLEALTSGTSGSYAYGINNSGTVVGTTYINGQAYGTIWNGSNTTQLGAGSYAMAINSSGEVVGGNGQAFTEANGPVQSLATQPGVDWSAAYGINDAGTVVGDGQLTNGTFRGIVWSPNGSMILLGTFGGANSQATGVNNSGEVVGFASLANGYQNAFSMIDALMIDLGTLGGSSYAYGVNESGEVVGYSYLADGDQHAFLYDDGAMLDLNSLIPGNSGWDLLAAYGINDAGQITGVGLYDGQLTAFLLTDPPAGPLDPSPVPEPHELFVLAAMLALVGAVGNRRLRYS